MTTFTTLQSQALCARIDQSVRRLRSSSCLRKERSAQGASCARTALTALGLIGCLGAAHAQVIYQGVGTAAATTAINNFRAAIGGSLNVPPSPQNGGRREINWDGVLLDGTDFGGNTVVIDLNHTVGIPINRFQGRGTIFAEVYAVSGDGFASVNPPTASAFPAFSPKNVFSMFSDNTIEMDFVLPSDPTTTPVDAGVRGFGAIFVGVQLPKNSSIEYFNGSVSLGKYFVKPGKPGDPEFLGVLYDQPVVTGAELTVGNKILFFFDGTTVTPGGSKDLANGDDISVLDDFVYAEPTAAAGIPTSVSLSPASVVGGKDSTGTVHLNQNAPAGGEIVNLLSSKPSIAAVPATVTVPAGSSIATFAITTVPVAANTSVVIKASVSGISTHASLTVKAPIPASVTFSPSTVHGGHNVTGKVTLNGAAAVNTAVALAITAGNSAVESMPSSIAIPAGATQATFTLDTEHVSAWITVKIQATANNGSKTGSFVVKP